MFHMAHALETSTAVRLALAELGSDLRPDFSASVVFRFGKASRYPYPFMDA